MEFSRVLSLSDFLYIPGIDFIPADPVGLKHNQKKLRWIIGQKGKRISSSEIARSQNVSVRYVNMIWKNYRDHGTMEHMKQGRKPVPMDREQAGKILAVREKYPNAGAIAIENYLLRDGTRISHNRIHDFLKETGMAMEEPNKKKQRKWVRYERRHSNSLWHMDWTEYGDEKILVIEDDASRFITGFGSFDAETTENSLTVLVKAIEEHGKPREIMTDHGTQFFSNGKDGNAGEPNGFQKFLHDNGIKHILARVKHPQTNGKLERVNGTLKPLRVHFQTWEEVVYHYNNERRHMSLSDSERPVVTPAMAYKEKMRNEEGQEEAA